MTTANANTRLNAPRKIKLAQLLSDETVNGSLWYKKPTVYSNYVTERFEQAIVPALEWGREAHITLVPTGTLIGRVTIELVIAKLDKTLPGSDPTAHFHNEIGYVMFNEIERTCAGFPLEYTTGIIKHIVQAIDNPDEKAPGYLIGQGNESQLQDWSDFNQRLSIDLDFLWPIPATALADAAKKTIYRLSLRDFQDVLVNTPNAGLLTPSETNGKILSSKLIVENIFLTPQEVNWVGHIYNNARIFTDTWQTLRRVTRIGVTGIPEKQTVDLKFFGVVKELLVTFAPQVNTTSPGNNNYFDFRAPARNISNPQWHPITELDVLVTGRPSNTPLSPEMAHKVNMKIHPNTTDQLIYCIPFCEKPADKDTFSGGLDFTSINDIQLSFKLVPEMVGEVVVNVYARTAMKIQFSDGLMTRIGT